MRWWNFAHPAAGKTDALLADIAVELKPRGRGAAAGGDTFQLESMYTTPTLG
jgi:hypothetical protein